MQIKTLDLNKLKKAPYNPRQISDDAKEGLRKSIQRFGLVELIIFNERTGHVVHGHQRLDVLLEQGVKKEKCIVVDLDESEEKALNVTMNNPNIQGEFTDRLQSLITEIDTGLDDILSDLRIDELLEEVQPKSKVIEHDRSPPGPQKTYTLTENQVKKIYALVAKLPDDDKEKIRLELDKIFKGE